MQPRKTTRWCNTWSAWPLPHFDPEAQTSITFLSPVWCAGFLRRVRLKCEMHLVCSAMHAHVYVRQLIERGMDDRDGWTWGDNHEVAWFLVLQQNLGRLYWPRYHAVNTDGKERVRCFAPHQLQRPWVRINLTLGIQFRAFVLSGDNNNESQW